MPTARSWTDAVRDVGPLLRFRSAAVRGRARLVTVSALTVLAILTLLAGWLPAHLPGAAGAPGGYRITSADLLLLLPSAYLGFLLVAVVSTAATGGGRELVPRDQAVAFPLSPATDHLGALLMAPLNIAWLMQAWLVLGATAYVVGPRGLIAAQVPILIWLLTATALAQLLAWAVEWLRRRYGPWAVRTLLVCFLAVLVALNATERLTWLLDRTPTRYLLDPVVYGSVGQWLPWLAWVAGIAALGCAAVLAGAALAIRVARRPARDELRVESAVHTPRTPPPSDLTALRRSDRAGVWRSVPLRRGLAFLALLPGLVALAGALEWPMIAILPGLVASGGGLLFGVNAWCLDGRGVLWRESLPVSPQLAFASRVIVLAEVLFLAIATTLLLASVRAGLPSLDELVAVLCAAVVVALQVVSASLRWSVAHPYAVDMRTARATPAPPLTMVAYSARLAFGTTMTGMIFLLTAELATWEVSFLFALPFVLFSLYRLVRTADSWTDPVTRARVAVTVAG